MTILAEVTAKEIARKYLLENHLVAIDRGLAETLASLDGGCASHLMVYHAADDCYRSKGSSAAQPSGLSTIGLISEGRRQNNILWMSLLEIALLHAPAETKAVLRQINQNDATISALLAELAK